MDSHIECSHLPKRQVYRTSRRIWSKNSIYIPSGIKKNTTLGGWWLGGRRLEGGGSLGYGPAGGGSAGGDSMGAVVGGGATGGRGGVVSLFDGCGAHDGARDYPGSWYASIDSDRTCPAFGGKNGERQNMVKITDTVRA